MTSRSAPPGRPGRARPAPRTDPARSESDVAPPDRVGPGGLAAPPGPPHAEDPGLFAAASEAGGRSAFVPCPAPAEDAVSSALAPPEDAVTLPHPAQPEGSGPSSAVAIGTGGRAPTPVPAGAVRSAPIAEPARPEGSGPRSAPVRSEASVTRPVPSRANGSGTSSAASGTGGRAPFPASAGAVRSASIPDPLRPDGFASPSASVRPGASGPSSAPSGPDRPAAAGVRPKLPPERVALMRDWVECTTHSFKRIGEKLGVSASTISRYAAEGGWQRPAGSAPPAAVARPNPEHSRGPAPPARPASDRRGQIVDRLWTLAERHAAVLEAQPIERAERALPPLARLTRTLGEIDRHRSPPPPDTPAADHPPARSLAELRDELQAHLDRIMAEEGDGWEVAEWWFEDGAGI